MSEFGCEADVEKESLAVRLPAPFPVTEFRSTRLDASEPDHLGPLLGFVGDELPEVGGRASGGHGALARLEETIRSLRRNAVGWPAEVDLVCGWYGPHLERIHEDAAAREADLVQLAQIASNYPSRERFLTELTLDPPDATSDEAGAPLLDEDYLILSTIHSAKGQEWTSVFLLNTVDGCLSSDLATGTTREIEEERRLLYVAMTRAKDQLHLMVPQRFFAHGQRSTGDRHIYAQRTRFIPNSILGQFANIAWPPPRSAHSDAPRPAREPLDVRAKMRSMWG